MPLKSRFSFKRVKEVAGNVFDDFFDDEITTRSAALAFYTSLALAPLLILIVVALGALGFNMQKEFVAEAAQTVGDESAKLLKTIMSAANERPDLSSFSGVIAGIGLVISASFIFVQLQETLNIIFDVEKVNSSKQTRTEVVREFLTKRLLSIGMLMAFIFILIASLALSSVIDFFSSGERSVLYEIIHFIFSLAIFALLFAGIFKYMPDRKVSFKSAIYGGGVTAVLFMVGKYAITAYIANSAMGSAYGAAGSLLVMLVWVYYSGLVVFVGAELAFATLLEGDAESNIGKSKTHPSNSSSHASS